MSAIDKLIQIVNAEVGYLEKSTTQNIGEILNPNTKDNRGARVL